MSAPARTLPKPKAPARRAPARKPAAPRARPALKAKPALKRRPAPRRAPVRRSTVVFVVVTGAIVVLMVLGLVAMNALLAQSSFKIDDLQARVSQLTQTYEQNRLEVAQLSSPARIATAAAKVGLVPAQGGIQILSPHPDHPTTPQGRKAVGGRR
jgi:cell division protein FtsL